MELMHDFLRPYFQFVVGASYSIQQSLDGLGMHGINFVERDPAGHIVNSYWSLDEAVVPILLAVSLFVCILSVVFVLAMRTLGGKGWKLGVAFLFAPGIASVLGLWPNLQWTPRVYVPGSGTLGSPMGMLTLIVMAMILGWSVNVLVTNRFKLNDKFRHGYDQFWYAMAVLTGLFFVSDLEATRNRENLKESAATSQAASAYLLSQVRQLDADCESGRYSSKLACEWAKRIQWNLTQYAHENARLYWQLGPDNMDHIYRAQNSSMSVDAIDELRLELHRFNETKCPVQNLSQGFKKMAPISKNCEMTPADFCGAYPERQLQGVDQFKSADTVAISNECIVPTLSVLKERQISMAKIDAENDTLKHVRWLFYLFFACIAGGKVANATIRMVGENKSAKNQNLNDRRNANFALCIPRLLQFVRRAINFLVRKIR